MKKIFFLLAFAFIGTQAYSQVYMLAVVDANGVECTNGLENDIDLALVKIDPLGNETIICDEACVDASIGFGCLGMINQEINIIVNEGYKLMAINAPNSIAAEEPDTDGLHQIDEGTIFIFAAP